jgi:hypothetical protein
LRVKNWPAKLAAALEEASTWGVCDFGCCDLVGHVAAAVTGDDRRSAFPAYSSQKEADALLTKFGGLPGIMKHAFGDPIPARKALRGDVVLADVEGEVMAGICIGSKIALRSRAGGLTYRTMSCARMAWSVG